MQLLRKLLFPISLIYALVVFVRNKLYDLNIIKSASFSTKTICIGNLSVGGTGKTPMTELLIRSLSKNNTVAVLSRGYKRKSNGFVLATGKTAVTEIGDEPYQLFSKFPSISVAVDADRRNGIQRLEKEIKPNIILLDDAFQHRKVKPDYSILLTTFGNLYTDDWYLPTGDLRDAKYAAGRANSVIVTKCPQNLSEDDQQTIKKKLNLNSDQNLLFAFLSYDTKLKNSTSSKNLTYFKDKKVTLITGIADAKPLVLFLNESGIKIEHLAYKDHHFFTQNELELFRTKECIITTEKDYTKLKDALDNVYYISVAHCFIGAGEERLQSDLKQLMSC